MINFTHSSIVEGDKKDRRFKKFSLLLVFLILSAFIIYNISLYLLTEDKFRIFLCHDINQSSIEKVIVELDGVINGVIPKDEKYGPEIFFTIQRWKWILNGGEKRLRSNPCVEGLTPNIGDQIHGG